MSNNSQDLIIDIALIRKNPYILNWHVICQDIQLNEAFMREFRALLVWVNVSRYQPLSENFIEEFEHLVDWDNISIYQKLSENFIRKFKNHVNWEYISAYTDLSESFIGEFHNYVIWDGIFERRYRERDYGEEISFSEDFIIKFKDRMYWQTIALTHDLSMNLMNELKNDIDWDSISKYQILNEYLIEEFKDYVNWKYISEYQVWINEDFIRKFKDRFDLNLLAKNERRFMVYYYSNEIIREFAPHFNIYYKYNMFSNRIQRRWKEIIYQPKGVGYKRSFDEFQMCCKAY